MSTPPNYDNTDLELARHLYAEGLVQDPDRPQQDTHDRPGVFFGDMPDTPDRALALAVTVEDRDEDDANPWLTVRVVMRSAPWGQEDLRATAGALFARLHDRTDYRLTATQAALVSRRISRGPELRDQNDRYIRVDTYRLRMAVPEGN